jgi:hypothetical protein
LIFDEFHVYFNPTDAGSSNGRTADSESAYLGSNPSPAEKESFSNSEGFFSFRETDKEAGA